MPAAVWPLAQPTGRAGGRPEPPSAAAVRAALGARLVADYTTAGDLLVVPDCRDPQLAAAAARAGRRALLLQPDPAAAGRLRRRLQAELPGPRRREVTVARVEPAGLLPTLAGRVDLLVHPPVDDEEDGGGPVRPTGDYAAAAALLRPGGLLVAITRQARRGGRLVDTAAAAVSAAQAAGLRYLQHVVVLTTAVDGAALVPPPGRGRPPTAAAAPAGPRHRLVHVDVTVFRRPGR